MALKNAALPAAGVSLAVLALCACAPVTYLPPPQEQYVQGQAPEQYVQGPPPAPTYYPETPAPAAPAAPNPLDQLMAPVALYPDPLISILLPATTFPADVDAAGLYLNGGGDPGLVDMQPWDQSVRSLAHYPDIVKWMAGNQQWTQAAGAAFVSQPAEVMEAIQRLRELARADGTLTDTPEQQVVVEGTYVEIEPAQAGVIYVPLYDPNVVFVDQPYYGYGGPFFAYGPPYEAGVWLTFGCNWRGGGGVIVDSNYWRGSSGGWRSHGEADFAVSAKVRAWNFPADRPRPQAPSGWRNSPLVINARPIGGAPAHPPQAAFRDIHTRGPGAVAVVGRNPQAFKGQPINTSILPRTSPPKGEREAPIKIQPPGTPAPRTEQAQRTNAIGMETRPEVSKPKPAAPRAAAPEAKREQEPARPEVNHAPAPRVEDEKRAPETRPVDEKVDPKAPKKPAKPPVEKKPAPEKPKQDEPSR